MQKKYIALVFALVAVGAVIYILFGSDNQEKTVKVEKKRFIKSVYASGFVDSVNKVSVKPEVSGYVEKVYVKERDKVVSNQGLAVISNEKLKEDLADVRARKELWENRLKEDSDYLKALRDETEIARLNMDIEKKNLNRRVELYEKGIVSRESYEEAESSYNVSVKSYNKSLETYNDSLSSLESNLESLTAQENAILEEIEKHTLVSPTDGEVLRKMVEEGDYVNHLASDNAMFSIGDSKRLETVLSVDEEYLPLIKLGQKVVITTDAFPGQAFEGRISDMELESDRRTRTVIVEAEVNYPENIPVGVTVEANIVLEDRDGLFIPEASYDEGFVNVKDDGGSLKVPVRTGVKQGEYIEITEGAQEDQEILAP